MRFFERLKNRIASSKGETLSETLVALLIIALAAGLLFTMTSTAQKMITKSDEAIAHVYERLGAAEEKTDLITPDGTVYTRITISDIYGSNSYNVNWYGQEDGFKAFSVPEVTP